MVNDSDFAKNSPKDFPLFKRSFQANEDHYQGKTKTLVQDSKKLDCPAKIIIKDVVFFPDYKVVS